MKNKAKRVGLYDPFLETLGGGEKYILSILEVFAEQGYEVNIFWDKNLTKEIKNRFAFRYIDPACRQAGTWKWLPNVFRSHPERSRGILNKISRLVSLARNDNVFSILKEYDYFFYVTDGSYFFSGAKKNFVYAMIPDKKLYSLNLINYLKLINYQFITHSLFTKKWLKRFGIKSKVIMPYLDNQLINQNVNFSKKEKIILSVGRFFSHLHSKRQDLIIKAFKKLKNKSKKISDYKLVLAGGLKKEDQGYFDSLKELASNDSSIIFKPNIKLYELYKLYELSNYFWHFTGYGIDEEKNPELVEHLGITPLEAMASGCLTFCYSAGGPKELIKDGENGFLFTDTNELIEKMIKVDSDEPFKKEVRNYAISFVKKEFSYKIFKDKVVSGLIKVSP